MNFIYYFYPNQTKTKPMKKIILLFAAVLSFTVANAQEYKVQKADAATRATTMTEKMSNVLALSADKKAKVQEINLQTIKLMDLNQEKTGDKPNEFEVEKQRISKKWDTEMTEVIGAEQLQKWKKHQADEKARK